MWSSIEQWLVLQEEEWTKDVIMPDSQELLGGRTPLQIACARDDNYKVWGEFIHYLSIIYSICNLYLQCKFQLKCNHD